MAMTVSKVFVGTIIHSFSPTSFELIENGAVGVNERGNIAFLLKDSSLLDSQHASFHFDKANITTLEKGKFLIPGFVDCHIHAPQYSFTGTGYDLPLLDWLDTYISFLLPSPLSIYLYIIV